MFGVNAPLTEPTIGSAAPVVSVSPWAAKVWVGMGLVGLPGLALMGVGQSGWGGRPVLVLLTMATVVGAWRSWRVRFRLGPDGVLIRNGFWTTRLRLDEVSDLLDARVRGGEGGPQWALGVARTEGTPVASTATAFWALRTVATLAAREAFIQNLRVCAKAYGLPVSATGITLATGKTHKWD